MGQLEGEEEKSREIAESKRIALFYLFVYFNMVFVIRKDINL